MFETYDDFTDELQSAFAILMDDNEPEDVESAVECVIETDSFGDLKEYFITHRGNSEEAWEDMLVEMCEEYIDGL